MSEKLTAALANLEKARTMALEAAIAERAYRVCVLFDADGGVQRNIDKARRMLNGKGVEKSPKK